MSIKKGKTLDFIEIRPAIRWNRKAQLFSLIVPDMLLKDGSTVVVYVSECDLYRMINADAGEWYFSFEDEQGDLSDDEYLGISLVQAYWYLSKNTLKIAKRASKKVGYPQWIYLKRKKPTKGFEDREEYFRENYLEIREKLVERGDFAEFCELERIVNKKSKSSARKLYLDLRNELY